MNGTWIARTAGATLTMFLVTTAAFNPQGVEAQSGLTYQWLIGSWGPCSVSCGSGLSLRVVVCEASDGSFVTDKYCKGTKPPAKQSCDLGACPDYEWFVGEWSACSDNCGGLQVRPVGCVDEYAVAAGDTLCPEPKPAVKRTCGTPAGVGCTTPVCGNGIVEAGEECDDGNRKSLDGCSAECRSEHVHEKETQRCWKTVARGLTTLGKAERRRLAACVNQRARDARGDFDADACARDLAPDSKVGKALAKAQARAEKACAILPSYGLGEPEEAADVALAAELEVLHDILGDSLTDALVPKAQYKPATMCQAKFLRAATALVGARTDTFVRCARTGLRATTIRSGDELRACLIADSRGAVERATARLGRVRSKSCAEAWVSTALSGHCAAQKGDAVEICVARRITCRMCLAVNAMYELDAYCDELDDGIINDSCL